MLSYLICFLSMISFSNAISCKGSAKYKLTFIGEWTAQSHPEGFPSNSKRDFSPLVGCSHNSSYVMWKPGMNATTGVKRVADSGSPTEMNGEIDQQITLKTALDRFNAGGIAGANGTTSVSNIQVNTEYPLVSAISMIAPSPDWFVGIHDYDLCNHADGKWIDQGIQSLSLYDAGIDSALTFVKISSPTIPPVPIFLLDNTIKGSLESNVTTKRFGTFTWKKTSEEIPNEAGSFGFHNIYIFFALLIASLYTM